ncbi:xanthine dehydrogenase YagS FAD-binding subunit [Streptomyces sp. 2333.5]|uniref:FAD binding domain-containing protein n=1 Tax=unclassified Streptomyces TaxID=2593676 RepID=UPI0008946406|nr:MULTISPECIES: xanthine dehydrogenase family protein subunit M [unclassified Streptomyces]PJJ06385.1 xanthine dehydrogenase YagS FAD-binding subunit [Streptomyces sp. 2333.5]SEE94647.1 xanthine dehydrogenase YagS FAD-binding subunit [Streptomyces sp. 2314.4]SEF09404.1 xanthine dehydrogenase YagS FAD-binding subunit [Streptomyces sp. 2112.2]SOE09276.1 xanthine dehydrogenase YagS FAD-binding subunit [Streptomyces sp. 2323.1]
MRAISYTRATDVPGAVAAVTNDPGSSFLAGGTTEVDLLRLDVLRPNRLVDINRLPLADIEDRADGGLVIGALARMSEVAEAPGVVERYPMLSQSLLLGASAQLRHMASMGGNLMQRVRCSYYRDPESACNKRVPGSGCSALEGVHRGHAILGTSEHCIATHPSDMAVALVALDAVVQVEGVKGTRTIPVDDFFLLPEDTPEREHPLTPGELITAIEVPALPMARRSLYLKVRDRESYEFALASAAVALALEDGVIRGVRLALGGVATKPWRAHRAEEMLLGQPADEDTFARAAAAELAPAVTRPMNAFKAELTRRTVVRALRTAAALRGEQA